MKLKSSKSTKGLASYVLLGYHDRLGGHLGFLKNAQELTPFTRRIIYMGHLGHPNQSREILYQSRHPISVWLPDYNESFDRPKFNNTGECDDLPPSPPMLPHMSEDASSTSGLPLPSPPLCVTELSALPPYVIPEITHPPSCITMEISPIPSMVPPSSHQQMTLIEKKNPEPIEQSVTPKYVQAVSASSLHDHRRENFFFIQKSQNQNNDKRVHRTHLYLLTKIRTLAEQFPPCLTQ